MGSGAGSLSPTERWTSCMFKLLAQRVIDVGDELLRRSRSQRSLCDRRGLGDPKPRRFNGHCGPPQTRYLVRILSALSFLQVPPKEIEQSLHGAEVHRGEPPCACRKPGLALVVSIAPHDLDRLDLDAGEIDGSSCRGAHPCAFQSARSARLGAPSFGRTINRRSFSSVAVTSGRSMWPAPEARTFRPSSQERPSPWISLSPFTSSVFQMPNSLPARASSATSSTCSRFPYRSTSSSALTCPSNSRPNGKLPEPIERRTSLREKPARPDPPHFTGKTALVRPDSCSAATSAVG